MENESFDSTEVTESECPKYSVALALFAFLSSFILPSLIIYFVFPFLPSGRLASHIATPLVFLVSAVLMSWFYVQYFKGRFHLQLNLKNALKLEHFNLKHIVVAVSSAVGVYIVVIFMSILFNSIATKLGITIGSNKTSNYVMGVSNPMKVTLSALSISILAPVCEELFFRGALLSLFLQYKRSMKAMVVSVIAVSVVFGLFHFQGFTGTLADVAAMVVPALIGVMCAIFRLKFNSLYPAIAFHMTYNIIVFTSLTMSH